MCGIAALISHDTHLADSSKLYAMMEQLGHRGNKPPITKQLGRAILGCARLAIVGRESGEQPLSNREGELTVVFNGEIYNHRELRSELERDGVKFQTECDTEVLLHGYKRWGVKLPDRLKGMYAFVLWDQAKGEFFAARDPFGMKPLYYAYAGQQWAFSSEIYPLTRVGFNDVKSLAPGRYMHNGQISDETLMPLLAPILMDEKKAKVELRRLIEQSVQRHLDTDLPVAIFCSGGIDSSILLFEAAQIKPKGITAFCVGTQDSEDLQFARQVAQLVNVNLRHVPIEQEMMVDSIMRTVATIESFEPNHIRAGTASLALARAVHNEGFQVVLVGEGADELFGGYEEFPKAVRNGCTTEEVEDLFRRFIGELHKTQLKRVDRTTMAFGIEARVPYLDIDLARFVMSIPTSLKLGMKDNKVWSKYILRQAYSDVLPEKIVWRRKVPMGEGAGVGDNGKRGPFFRYTQTAMTNEEFSAIRRRHPEFDIKTREEAYYFTIFEDRFGALNLARRRPLSNVEKTT
jgi:asparagine synthase (glutamine-hydrolysing)